MLRDKAHTYRSSRGRSWGWELRLAPKVVFQAFLRVLLSVTLESHVSHTEFPDFYTSSWIIMREYGIAGQTCNCSRGSSRRIFCSQAGFHPRASVKRLFSTLPPFLFTSWWNGTRASLRVCCFKSQEWQNCRQQPRCYVFVLVNCFIRELLRKLS